MPAGQAEVVKRTNVPLDTVIDYTQLPLLWGLAVAAPNARDYRPALRLEAGDFELGPTISFVDAAAIGEHEPHYRH